MAPRIFLITLLSLAAIIPFFSSELAAASRELAEDSNINPAEATTDHSEVGDAKYYGYGGYGPGYGGYGPHRGYPGRGRYGGYPGGGRGGYGWYPGYGRRGYGGYPGGWYGGYRGGYGGGHPHGIDGDADSKTVNTP